MQLILTVISEDRPGVVEAVSDVIATGGGNWLDSRMATMAGRFVGIVRVQVADRDLSGLREALADLGLSGIHVRVEAESPIGEIGGRATAAAAGQTAGLSVVGNDRPGIVHEVTAALSRIGVNVLEFTSTTTPAQMSGGEVFRAELVLSLSGVDLVTVADAVESVSSDLMVEWAPGSPLHGSVVAGG